MSLNRPVAVRRHGDQPAYRPDNENIRKAFATFGDDSRMPLACSRYAFLHPATRWRGRQAAPGTGRPAPAVEDGPPPSPG
jgi:hypothetical protein